MKQPILFKDGQQSDDEIVQQQRSEVPIGQSVQQHQTHLDSIFKAHHLRRKVHEGPVQCGLGSSRGGGLDDPISSDQNSGNRDMEWNVTSLGGKEPELVREVEVPATEIVGLTSTHGLGSGTQLLERGWTLHYSGVAQGERRLVWACL
ncbi:hypothetical protein L3Q82_011440 [Scortum barcoo]|uniref:Uncharacterized protein n=1 Tax=Scortum barcoo TaxID=214431 RepID=A0ACB8WAM6_9TELE|nr:hypothetical protein L3Q82_011440 [Scortum barcoo]